MSRNVMNRQKMMQMLDKYLKFIRPSEDFSKSKGDQAIWVSGEDCDEYNGRVIFNYYTISEKYTFGVLNEFAHMLKQKGWYCEWYDAGTMFIYPIGK